MNAEKFENVIEDQLNMCKSILTMKAKEYATEDRLHNFKIAAHLQQVSDIRALGGMMSKHTVSVYDMCSDEDIKNYDLSLWEEKITDSINYLLLLKALVIEKKD